MVAFGPRFYNVADVKDAVCVEIETIVDHLIKVEYVERQDNDDDVALVSHSGTAGIVLVDGIHVATPDLMGIGGVFHGLDVVIVPRSFSPGSTEAVTTIALLHSPLKQDKAPLEAEKDSIQGDMIQGVQ
eukprot:scaffold2125_cov126-Cylindrotheca_fusiformis.AAC.4